MTPVAYDKNRGNPFLTADTYQRETLHYSAEILEEIMWQIQEEYARRGSDCTATQAASINAGTFWKKYKTPTDSTNFKAVETGGTNVKNIPVKYFPLVVRDIMNAIDGLINDGRVPDTYAAYFARIFNNYTTATQGLVYDEYNSIPITYHIPGSGAIRPQDRLAAGSWPFGLLDLCENNSFIGVDASGGLHTKFGPRGIWTSATGWPQSVISKRENNKIAGIASGVKMTALNRPVIDTHNTEDGIYEVGGGKTDPDQGYGYMSHPAFSVQQIRYQPPIVEWIPEDIQFGHYVSSMWSNQTPNLPYYFGQPTERMWMQNWGNWIAHGHVGTDNIPIPHIDDNLTDQEYTDIINRPWQANPHVTNVNSKCFKMSLESDPMVETMGIAQCPYSVFYPPPGSYCSCRMSQNAGFVWWAYEYGNFSWNAVSTWQSRLRGAMKYFGPHTVLKFDYVGSDPSANPEANGTLKLGIKTAAIGTIDAPWMWITLKNNNGYNYQDDTYQGLRGSARNAVMAQSTPDGVNTYDRVISFSVPLINLIPYPGGRPKIDGLMALRFYTDTTIEANWYCNAVDGKGGSYLPASCFQSPCTFPKATHFFVTNIRLEEQPWSHLST